MNSTDIEFDGLWNRLENDLLKECAGFIKSALEVGFKTKNLKLVYKTFGEYSTTIKSLLPAKSQKEFEKTRTNIVIKFIRFILTTRMSNFKKLDYAKFEKKWTPGHEHQMKAAFEVQNSVFLKHFYKVVDEKYDREKFQKYWFMTMGKETGLLIKFYDDSLKSFDCLLKAYSKRDENIRSFKHKAGIKLPQNAQEMKNLSLTRTNSNKIYEILASEISEAKCEDDESTSTSTKFNFSKAFKAKQTTRSLLQVKKDTQFFDSL